MFDSAHDARVRSAAFRWLEQANEAHGDVLPRQLLAQAFMLDDIRVPLVGPQGIFKPRVLDQVPLSITTSPQSPYGDAFGSDDVLRYCYRGTDPEHSDNRGLRFAMQRRLPLVYFHGLVPGRYLAAWPVYVVSDDRGQLVFSVQVDDHAHLLKISDPGSELVTSWNDSDQVRRRYITAEVRVRLHQRAFRERVIDAYRRQCAFCRLRHEELLDAAHIVPDAHPEGEPVVRNGLAHCSLHHAAFDRSLLGVRPDYVIEVRPDILREKDGPTLVHAIQALHGTRIQLPIAQRHHPDSELLEIRYSKFRQAV